MRLLKEQNPSWVFIKMLEGEHEYLKTLGRARNENGKALGWKSKTKTDDDSWNIAGVAGEWAASLLYNLPVGCITSKNAKWLNEVGDVGGFIEVRASRGVNPWQWDLGSFRSAIKSKRPYVHAISGFLPEWMIITGWAWGHELWDSKKILPAGHHDKSDPIHWLEQHEIRDPLELFNHLRERELKNSQ